MVNREFVQLCSKAWSLRVLVYLYNGKDARISPMAHHLNAGRTAVTASLHYLIELGYVKRARGHGHPLRPAYVLSKRGAAVAAWALELDEQLKPEHWAVAARTWSLPVMRLTSITPRFGKLRQELAPITDRALSQTIKTLHGYQWIDRIVDIEASPPEVSYAPYGFGDALIPCLERSFDL